MKDLAFDTTTRELMLSNGDFALTDNPSIQNGMIIKDCKGINILSPILGIGFNPINAQANSIVFDLNRWKKQCKQDGAIVADFFLKQSGIPTSVSNIDYNIAYQ